MKTTLNKNKAKGSNAKKPLTSHKHTDIDTWLVPKQCLHSKKPKPSPPMIFYGRGYPFGHFGSAVLVTSSPNIWCSPNLLFCWGRVGKRGSPSAIQAMPQHCATIIALVTNPNQSSVWKKINSIPPGPEYLCVCAPCTQSLASTGLGPAFR